jgi:hypothetical protein
VSILSDELLRSLMAVGEVDVLVGLPTLNHADTVGAHVRAAHVAFNRELARERTLFMNVDGGSNDGTPEIVRDASLVERETVLASQSLRTRHRISTPYHGVPGKVGALRTLFAAADLLHARVVVVLDPEVTSTTAESIAALARPVLAGEAQFVSPAFARHPLDGPLVTQLVRPLFRAAYGLRLREPLAGELACSDGFAAVCLERPEWQRESLRTGIDLWLTTVAALGPFRVAEVPLGPRQLAPRPRPAVATLVSQVLQALFEFMRDDERVWPARVMAEAVPLLGAPPETPEPTPLDVLEFAGAFRDGVAALEPILAGALSHSTLEGLRAAGASPLPLIPDALWTEAVCEMAAAFRSGRVSHGHLLRAAGPLYLGRVAAFVGDCGALELEQIERRLEELALQFERSKPALVALWTAAMR